MSPKLYLWYPMSAAGNNGVLYPEGDNPLGLGWNHEEGFDSFVDGILPGVEAMKPDGVVFHNPFGQPAGYDMVFHQVALYCKTYGKHPDELSGPIMDGLELLHAKSLETWVYLGSMRNGPKEGKANTRNPTYTNQQIEQELSVWPDDTGLVFDTAGLYGTGDIHWRTANRAFAYDMMVGYEPRPRIGTPWGESRFTCFGRAKMPERFSLSDGLSQFTEGHFRKDPIIWEGTASEDRWLPEEEILGETTIYLYGDPNYHSSRNYQKAVAFLMSKGYNVAIYGYRAEDYFWDAPRIKNLSNRLAERDSRPQKPTEDIQKI